MDDDVEPPGKAAPRNTIRPGERRLCGASSRKPDTLASPGMAARRPLILFLQCIGYV